MECASPTAWRIVVVATVAAGGICCVGDVGDATTLSPDTSDLGGAATPRANAPATAGSPGEPPQDNRPAAPTAAPAQPAPGQPAPSDPGALASPTRGTWRRLTRFEYNNTVRDLLGESDRPADRLPEDEGRGTFSALNTGDPVAPNEVEVYASMAESLAASAVKRLTTLVPCKPDPANDGPCARTFIEQFGTRAFRRPLSADEIERLTVVYKQARAESDFTGGIQALLQVMLQSPHFIYRIELPGPAAGALRPLGAHEVASRLSYLLWSSMPDQALLDAARAGRLAASAGVEEQARRMLGDAKARELGNFFRQWLWLSLYDGSSKSVKGLDLFRDLFPMQRAALTETLNFVDAVMRLGDGKLGTLLTSTRTSINGPLATLYGVPGIAQTDTSFRAIELDPSQRAGVLTQASVMWMTAHYNRTSPTLRGKFVREQLLCQTPPPPPPDVESALPASKSGQSTRGRFLAHVENPVCATCHKLMDPIGFSFESYDLIGRFRTSDNGAVVDTAGEVFGSRDADGKYAGPVPLARKLAASAQVRDCFAEQMFRYTHGRDADALDASSVKAGAEAFASTGGDMRELLVAMTRTDAFRSLTVEESR